MKAEDQIGSFILRSVVACLAARSTAPSFVKPDLGKSDDRFFGIEGQEAELNPLDQSV